MLLKMVIVLLICQGERAKLPIPSVLTNSDWPISEDEIRKSGLADSKPVEEILKTYIGNVMVAQVIKYLTEEIDKTGNAEIYKKIVQIASTINASKQERLLMVDENLVHISTPSVNYMYETSLADGAKIDAKMESGNTSKLPKGMAFAQKVFFVNSTM